MQLCCVGQLQLYSFSFTFSFSFSFFSLALTSFTLLKNDVREAVDDEEVMEDDDRRGRGR
jgi:hypothetical protein